MLSPADRKRYRFGPFEVDPTAGEVRKQGLRIRVQEQPLLLLTALLERPGALITREELHNRLWPGNTFVDFENGLNTAAARLRQALGDSAKTPRFIESVPRRGYRFIAPVETVPTGEQPPEHPLPLPATRLRRLGSGPLLTAAALALSAALLAWWSPFRNRSGDARSFKFSLIAPEEAAFVPFDPPILSPDGRLVAFPAAGPSGDTELWIRPLNELAARPLAGTRGAAFPFWSPDSRGIAFFAQAKLYRIDLDGGPPRILCDAPDGRGGTWNRRGAIVFSPSLKSPLLQVSAAGGQPTPLTTLDASRGEVSHRWPHFLPDGHHFLYTIRTTTLPDSGVYLGSLNGDPAILLFRTLSNAIYASDKSGAGHLLFAHEGALVARPFDPRRFVFTGPEFSIAESVSLALIMEPLRAEFSASDTGVLAYRLRRGLDRLAWFDRKGAQLGTLGDPGIHVDVTLSPDDREITFSRLEPHTGKHDVWRVDRLTGVTSRVTAGPKDQVGPTWSPDQRHLFYSSSNLRISPKSLDRSADIFEITPDGGSPRLLLKSDHLKIPWSANGQFLLYHEIRSSRKIDTWALSLQPGASPVALLQGTSNQLFAVFSPDGKWVAYTSDASGKQEVYVTPFLPGTPPAGQWIISQGGGSHPEWPGDGKQIYYLAPDKRIMAVPVSFPAGRFHPGTPHPLFQSDIIEDFRARFAVTSDGQRLLIPVTARGAGSSFATVIVNWAQQDSN